MARVALALLLVIGCSSSQQAPALTHVTPSAVAASLGGVISLHGEGFVPSGPLDLDHPERSPFQTNVSAALISADDVRVELEQVTWVDARTVDALVPLGVPVGSWGVELVTPRGEVLTLANAVELMSDLDGGLDDGGVDDAGCRFTFADADRDGFGNPDSGVRSCEADRVRNGDDCNDVDALSAPSRAEQCNGFDDDCDALIDEGVCADAGFTFTRSHALDGMGRDFASAWAFAPESLWLAGGAHLFFHEPDAGFRDVSAGCPANLTAVWADATGRAFVAGGTSGAGRLATATLDGGCGPSQNVPQLVAGLVGFTSRDGGVQVEVVLRDGRRASWDGVGPVEARGAVVPAVQLSDAHGASATTLYAVGVTTSNPRRPVVLRLQEDGGFVSEQLPQASAQLNGLWVVSPTEVVAVGDDGLVLRRVNGAWQRISPPSTANYTTVRAFSIGRFYLSTVYGYVRQWSGAWTLHYTDQVPVRDLTAFDEAHFWLVGDNGLLISNVPP